MSKRFSLSLDEAQAVATDVPPWDFPSVLLLIGLSILERLDRLVDDAERGSRPPRTWMSDRPATQPTGPRQRIERGSGPSHRIGRSKSLRRTQAAANRRLRYAQPHAARMAAIKRTWP
jgi:hypothetical protein